MTGWNRRTKAIWDRLALGGVTLQKRHERNPGYRYGQVRWFMTVPITNYLMGPYASKSEAVMRAAAYMELDTRQIELPPRREYRPDGA